MSPTMSEKEDVNLERELMNISGLSSKQTDTDPFGKKSSKPNNSNINANESAKNTVQNEIY